MASRCDHPDHPPVALQRRGHTSAHQRRLAATRRPGHREQVGRRYPSDTFGDLAIAAEEHLGVADVVGDQPEIWAHRARLRAGVDALQGWVVDQDRPLQRHQLRPRVHAQRVDQRRAGPLDRAQGVTLAATAVLRQRQLGPPTLAQRRLDHPRAQLGQHPCGVRRPTPPPTAAPPRPDAAPPTGPPPPAPAPSPPTPRAAAPATTPTPHPTCAPPARPRRRRAVPGPDRPDARSDGRPPPRPAPSTGSRAWSSRSPRTPTPGASASHTPAPPCSTTAAACPPTALPPTAPFDRLTRPQRQHRQHHPIPRPQRTVPVHRHRTQHRDAHCPECAPAPRDRQPR